MTPRHHVAFSAPLWAPPSPPCVHASGGVSPLWPRGGGGGGGGAARVAAHPPRHRRDGGRLGRRLCGWRRARHGTRRDVPCALAASADASASAPAKARVALPRLTATDFRHPVDERATRDLERFARFTGLGALVRRFIGPVLEQMIELENVSSGVLVGPEQLPALHRALVEACDILALDPPDLFVRQNPAPNAYTLAINGQRPFIVLHNSLVDMLTERELQAVIAHELGHLKCEHGVWITAANVLIMTVGQVGGELGRMIGDTIARRLLQWLRAAELSCDRASLLVMQDARPMVSVLMKLSGGVASVSGMNPDAFLKQARRFEEATASSSRIGRRFWRQMQQRASHPLPVLRAREMDRWANSPAFRAILRDGVPLAS